MEFRNNSILLEKIKKLQKKENMKMSYIMNNLDQVNEIHSIGLTKEEKDRLQSKHRSSISNLRSPFDISRTMRPK